MRLGRTCIGILLGSILASVAQLLSAQADDRFRQQFLSRLRDFMAWWNGPLQFNEPTPERLQSQLAYFRERRTEGESIVAGLVHNAPRAPDWAAQYGIPKDDWKRMFPRGMAASGPNELLERYGIPENQEFDQQRGVYDEAVWLYSRACLLAGELEYEGLQAALESALEHEDPRVIVPAAQCLGRLGCKGSVPKMLAAAEREPWSGKFCDIAEALARLMTAAEFAKVLDLGKSKFPEDVEVFTRCKKALAEIQEREGQEKRGPPEDRK